MNYHSVSWKQLHTLTYQLAKKIEKDNKKIDLIVGVARGGLTISHIVSDFLQLSVASFTISSYKDLQQQELSDISYQVGGHLKNMNILLVDDVSDTGKTFIRGIEHLKEMGAQHVITGSVFIKPWTQFVPDYYAKSVNDWIVFPFDMRDTVEDVAGFMKKDGETLGEITTTLLELKIPRKYIEQYLKY
jgi:hypoxanthine phosphoribosyltransferase